MVNSVEHSRCSVEPGGIDNTDTILPGMVSLKQKFRGKLPLLDDRETVMMTKLIFSVAENGLRSIIGYESRWNTGEVTLFLNNSTDGSHTIEYVDVLS